jgi:hypothetical protein
MLPENSMSPESGQSAATLSKEYESETVSFCAEGLARYFWRAWARTRVATPPPESLKELALEPLMLFRELLDVERSADSSAVVGVVVVVLPLEPPLLVLLPQCVKLTVIKAVTPSKNIFFEIFECI